MEKVTVIIPVFNADSTLRRCIDAVLAQDHTDWELLLVDDNSTDGSAEICRHYAAQDSRIRYFRSPASGPSAARNLGLDHASSDYLCFIDADDYARHDYLSKLLQPFRGFRIQLSFSGYYEIATPGSRPKPFHDLEELKPYDVVDAALVRTRLLHGTAGLICGKMFLMEVIRAHQVRFRCDLRLQEDLIFALEYANRIERVAVVNDSLYYYDRSNLHSLSSRRDDSFLTNSFRALEYLRDLYRDGDITLHLEQRRRAALLSYTEAVAVRNLPLGRKMVTLKQLSRQNAADLRTFPGDSLRMRTELALLRDGDWLLYILSCRLLLKLRRARGISRT